MQKILIYTPAMEVIGGLETHVVQLSRRLAAAGWEVTLLTTSNSCNDDARVTLRETRVEFLEMPVARLKTGRFLRLGWLLGAIARLRFRRWDVVYTNAQGELARFVWWAAGRKTRVIHHHHTAGDEAEQKATWSVGFARILANAPELVACSNYTRTALSRRLARQDITVLPCVTEELPRRVAEHELGARLKFGFLGRLARSKGIDTILELSRDPLLNSIEWHIHGAGPDYSATDFAGYPTVLFHGRYQGAAEQAEILENLDAVVLFSRHSEGLPLTLIEAMAAGLPWIATDKGGTRELAQAPENCRVLAPEASPTEIRAAVLDLAEAIRLGHTSRERQRMVYTRGFEPEAVFKRWQTFFSTGRTDPP